MKNTVGLILQILGWILLVVLIGGFLGAFEHAPLGGALFVVFIWLAVSIALIYFGRKMRGGKNT